MEKSNYSNDFFSKNGYPPIAETEAPIIVGTYLKSPENIGHLLRLGANIGCRQLLFVDNDPQFRLSKIKKVAGAAYDQVKWQFCTETELKKQLPPNYTSVALETAPNSKNLFQHQLPAKMTLYIGNEVQGIPASLMQEIPTSVHIPMCGPIKSMNVTHATSVAIFLWLQQHLSQ